MTQFLILSDCLCSVKRMINSSEIKYKCLCCCSFRKALGKCYQPINVWKCSMYLVTILGKTTFLAVLALPSVATLLFKFWGSFPFLLIKKKSFRWIKDFVVSGLRLIIQADIEKINQLLMTLVWKNFSDHISFVSQMWKYRRNRSAGASRKLHRKY